MNIDILFTPKNETGLVANENFAVKIAGIVLDKTSGTVTLEFADSDYLEMNIPLELARCSVFDDIFHMHVGSVKSGQIGQAYQVPIMVQDDPYRAEMLEQIPATDKPLSSFQSFVRKAKYGQPLHRDDVGSEDSRGCVLGDSQPSSLEFAPHLVRRQTLEATPNLAPRGPAPSAPGLGMGGAGNAGINGHQGNGGNSSG